MRIISLMAQCKGPLAGVLLTGIIPIATAQQAALNAPAVTATASGNLDEIVVTAQRREQRLQDVPISITALSGAQLAQAGVVTAADLPTVVSGLVWSNQGAWVEPNLRGVYTNVAAVGSASPIAIYLDGIYQPTQSGTIMQLPDISRIEVLKGPQGTLFGRNATGGAISIFTLDPTFTPTGKFDLGAGMFGGGDSKNSGHYSFNGYVAGPLIADTVAGSLSVGYDDIDGYLTDDVNGQREGRSTSATIRGKVLWKISDAASILASAYYVNSKNGTAEAGIPLYGVTAAAQYPDAILPSKPWHYTFGGAIPNVGTDIRAVSIKGTFDFDAGTLTSMTGYSNYSPRTDVAVAAAYSPACVAVFACINGNVQVPEEAYSQEFDFASKKYGGFSYVAGLFYFYDSAHEYDSYNGGVFFDQTHEITKSYAAFAEGTYEFTDQFSVIGGMRVNHEEKNADGSYFGAPLENYAHKGWTSGTPRASLIYKITPVVNTYFTYSQGFKGGVVSGQATTAPPADPEKITAYELGMKAATQDWSLNSAVFYYNYRDLQSEIFNDLVTTPQNAAKARIIGLDVDAAYKFTNAFTVRFASTWLPTAKYTSFPDAIAFQPPLGPGGLVTNQSYDATGARMLATPNVTATLSGVYGFDIPWGRVETTASVYHSGQYRWEYQGWVNTQQYTLLNGQMELQPRDSNFKYTLYGKNLTNKWYIQGALPTATANEVFYAAPREVGVRLGYSF